MSVFRTSPTLTYEDIARDGIARVHRIATFFVLSPHATRVLLALIRHSDKYGLVKGRPQRELADDCHISIRSVRSAIEDLARMEIVTVIKETDHDGATLANTYKVSLPEVPEEFPA